MDVDTEAQGGGDVRLNAESSEGRQGSSSNSVEANSNAGQQALSAAAHNRSGTALSGWSSYFCTPMSLLRFLSVFLSNVEQGSVLSSVRASEFDWERLAASWLCFTCFCQTNVSIDRSMLLRAFQRNCALNAKVGQYGFDLVIPLVLATRKKAGDKEPAPVLPTEQSMSGIFIQVKNYTRASLSGTGYTKMVDGLHNWIQVACGDSQPCMALIMQVGSQPISAKTNKGVYRDRVFVRDNVLYVVKPAMDTLRYPYATGNVIDMLRETATLMSNKGSVDSAFEEVKLQPQFRSDAYANGLDPIGFDS
jgi:hypothetical protein